MSKLSHCINNGHAKAAIIILVLSAVLLIPDLWMYPGTDYGVYFNGGRLILQGKIPYRDFWDHKTPLIYLYTAVWQLIFGSGWWSAKTSLIPIYGLYGISIYIFDVVLFPEQKRGALTSALTGVYLALRLGFDPARNGAILALATSLEVWSLASIYALFRHGSKSGSKACCYWIKLVIVGALSACAFLVRQTSIVPLLVYIVTRKMSKEKTYTRFRDVLLFVIGYVVIIGSAILILVGNGVRGEWILRQVVAFNRIYVAHYVRHCDSHAFVHWMMIFLGNAFWWWLVLVGALLLSLRRMPPAITDGLLYAYVSLSLFSAP